MLILQYMPLYDLICLHRACAPPPYYIYIFDPPPFPIPQPLLLAPWVAGVTVTNYKQSVL